MGATCRGRQWSRANSIALIQLCTLSFYVVGLARATSVERVLTTLVEHAFPVFVILIIYSRGRNSRAPLSTYSSGIQTTVDWIQSLEGYFPLFWFWTKSGL